MTSFCNAVNAFYKRYGWCHCGGKDYFMTDFCVLMIPDRMLNYWVKNTENGEDKHFDFIKAM
jgi:hypothetical protein